MGNSAVKFMDKPKDQKAIQKAFKTFDSDGNGTLDRTEFNGFVNAIVEHFVKHHSDQKDCFGIPIAERGDYLYRYFKDDEEAKKEYARELADLLWAVVNPDQKDSVTLEEWKSVEWGNIKKDAKALHNDGSRKYQNDLKGTIAGRVEVSNPIGGTMDVELNCDFSSAYTNEGYANAHGKKCPLGRATLRWDSILWNVKSVQGNREERFTFKFHLTDPAFTPKEVYSNHLSVRHQVFPDTRQLFPVAAVDDWFHSTEKAIVYTPSSSN